MIVRLCRRMHLAAVISVLRVIYTPGKLDRHGERSGMPTPLISGEIHENGQEYIRRYGKEVMRDMLGMAGREGRALRCNPRKVKRRAPERKRS
ncbi:UNVERIFIED_CONTAM: hypothetical protein PYX00_000105 [Menopon gallinae]|uniref:Uncharacterized protein n=1 Tax=Menopon gallinae TaxID=328185 RepID=A0AAW2I8Y5_9NEOP